MSYDELVGHGIGEKFARILSNPSDFHPDLSIHIGRTDWDYFIPDGVTDIVPLWDENADSYVRWNRNGKVEYILVYHDDPKWSLVAVSEQGVMAELWSGWAEFQETDDECRRFAEAIGFKYCEEAMKLWEDNYDSFQEWKKTIED